MKKVEFVVKCPTCGHIHPNGLGIAYCLCRDCGLLSHTGFLSEKMAKRKRMLLRKADNKERKGE